jgi:hypothetical protein
MHYIYIMDIITVNLIISSLTLLFSFLDKLKFKHCESSCFKGCEGDCLRTPPNTPHNEREHLLNN